MGFDTKALNKLLKKLDDLSTIESKKMVKEVAEEMADVIQDNCPEDSGDSKKAVGICDVREYETGTYIDVGFSQSSEPFEEWKGAWFNQWGWNSGGEFHSPHIGWFNEAIESKQDEVMNKLKKKIREEMKNYKE